MPACFRFPFRTNEPESFIFSVVCVCVCDESRKTVFSFRCLLTIGFVSVRLEESLISVKK